MPQLHSFMSRKSRRVPLDLDPQIDAFFEAARRGDEKAILDSLQAGVEVNVANSTGTTALHVAAFNNCFEVIPLLIQKGANPELKKEPNGLFASYTALHCTTECECVAAAQALLENGADINSRSAYGETPLRVAVETSGSYRVASPEIARFLIENGADINACSDDGESVLDEVARAIRLSPGDKPSQEIFDFLVARGAAREKV